MAYYFAVETEKNSFVALNIRKSGYFGKKSNYYQVTNSYQYTLQEIDEYTMKFKNESGLKDCLISEKIIPPAGRDSDKELAIIYTSESEGIIVTKQVLYKKYKTMKEKPSLILEYIKSKYNDNDFTFFQKLCEAFPEKSKERILINQSILCIEQKLIDDSKTSIDETAINYLIERAGELICSNLNYEILHNILSIISEYEETLNKSSEYKKTKKPHQ